MYAEVKERKKGKKDEDKKQFSPVGFQRAFSTSFFYGSTALVGQGLLII
jgi:hypothetical protein